MTAWIVTDGSLWGKLTEIRRREIRAWLRMNDIDPLVVPVDSTVLVTEDESGWVIKFEVYLNGDYTEAEDRSVPLAIDPPQYWLIPAIAPAA